VGGGAIHATAGVGNEHRVACNDDREDHFPVRGGRVELIARRAVQTLEGDENKHLEAYTDSSTPQYAAMVEQIRKEMGFDSLKYQTLDDMVKAIGLPKESLCTYCWDGKEDHCPGTEENLL